MALQMDIQIADDVSESIEEPPPSSSLLTWAQAAWQGEVDAEPMISLRIVSAAESQQLNHDYRGINKPTNVLSFPMQLEELFPVNEDMEEGVTVPDNILGDLAICAEVVEREAIEQNKSRDAHWAHMLVHGMLHLQGFDHIEDDEAEQMEQLETQLMQKMGFADPYQMNIPHSTKTEKNHERSN